VRLRSRRCDALFAATSVLRPGCASALCTSATVEGLARGRGCCYRARAVRGPPARLANRLFKVKRCPQTICHRRHRQARVPAWAATRQGAVQTVPCPDGCCPAPHRDPRYAQPHGASQCRRCAACPGEAYAAPAVVWAVKSRNGIDMEVRAHTQCILATLPTVGPARVSPVSALVALICGATDGGGYRGVRCSA